MLLLLLYSLSAFCIRAHELRIACIRPARQANNIERKKNMHMMCFDESSNERGRRLYTAESCACPSALHRFDCFCCMHCYHILAASWMHFFILPVHTRCARAFARSTKTSNAKKYYLWFWKVYAPSKRNCYNKTKLWVRLCAWRMRYGCDHRMYVDWSFVPIEYAEMRIYTFAKFTRTQHTHTHICTDI